MATSLPAPVDFCAGPHKDLLKNEKHRGKMRLGGAIFVTARDFGCRSDDCLSDLVDSLGLWVFADDGEMGEDEGGRQGRG